MIWEALNTIYVKPVYYKSQKKFSKAHVARDGTLKNQPNKVGTILLHHPYILCHFAKYYLCAQKGCLGHGRLCNEQYWVCSACCCVWRVGCVVAGSKFCCN